MTHDLITTIEGFSSARIAALQLSRKLWKVRDELQRYVDSSDEKDPINRDMQSLYEDEDHIVKLLGNMDDRFAYIQHNQQRHALRSEGH